jgi:uncharacterized coiled-coil protein SlyX
MVGGARRPLVGALIVAAALLAACAGALPRPKPGPAERGRPPDPSLATASPVTPPEPTVPAAALAAERAERQRLDMESQALRAEVERQHAMSRDLEERLARLRIQLLERDARIETLSQQLDTAIREVVRAMAKLRSLESKAEAASSLAEAEVALKVVQREATGRDSATVAQAERLLKLGAEEFKRENYGGALYLGTQAKGLLKVAPRESRVGSVETSDGEVPFALPLRLRAASKANVRGGPGSHFNVVFVTPQGAPLTGQSYKGQWVRIRSQDGRSGWIHYSLVGER